MARVRRDENQGGFSLYKVQKMGSKSLTILQLFLTQDFINKILYYDQMPVRRVDLHMLNSVSYNFQTAMLSLARDIQ